MIYNGVRGYFDKIYIADVYHYGLSFVAYYQSIVHVSRYGVDGAAEFKGKAVI